MKETLYDIELDFCELKCFLDFIAKDPSDEKLQRVALRALNKLAQRVDCLKEEFITDFIVAEKTTDCVVPKQATAEANDLPDELQRVRQPIDSPLAMIPACEATPEIEVEEVKRETEKVADTLEEPALSCSNEDVSTNEVLKESMYRALSLNDVFYYTREFFQGNSLLFKEEIRKLELLGSYEEANRYLKTQIANDVESEAFLSFDDFLKKYFNN